MKYVKIENNNIIKIYNNKPEWFFDDGSQVDDIYLKGENILPVIDETITEEHVYFDYNPVSDWIIESDRVIRTKTIFIEDNSLSYDSFYQMAQKKDKAEYIKINDNKYQITYNIIDKTLSDKKNELFSKIANLRFNYEVGGMLFKVNESNYSIFTDRESQSKITAVFIAAKEGIFTDNRSWKVKEGFISLTPAQVQELAMSFQNHVQNCYNNEERIYNLIMNNNDMSDLKNVVDNEFNKDWPVNSLYNSEV